MANHCLTTATCECGPGRHAARRQASDQVSIDSQALHTRCPYKRQTRQAFTSSRLGGSSRSRPGNIAPRHRNGEAVRAVTHACREICPLTYGFANVLEDTGDLPRFIYHPSVRLASELLARHCLVCSCQTRARNVPGQIVPHGTIRPNPCPHRPLPGPTRVYIGP